jgi:hypothetical protein
MPSREHSRSRAGADQPFGLEGLDAGLAKVLGFGIEEPAPRAPDAIGLQRLLQRTGLKKDRKTRECAFRYRSARK